MAALTVGVLALQGDFTEFIEAVSCFNVSVLPVRTPDDLAHIDGLIIPGGESTAIGILSDRMGMLQPLRDFVQSGNRPIWGICAGLIMLSDKVTSSNKHLVQQPLLGGLHVETLRNAFGRQIQSAVRPLELTSEAEGFGLAASAHFIRAPTILRTTSSEAVVLAEVAAADERKYIAAVKQGHLLATAFHTEVSADLSWVRYFLEMVHKSASNATARTGRQDSTHSNIGIPALKQRNLSTRPPIPPPGAKFQLRESVKRAMPRFLQGGVIMDVVNGEQARIAEAAGACAVMALERIPADIKADGGVARMSDPLLIKDVMANVSIPVMAKARIGHFGEARVIQSLNVDCIDESEVLTVADTVHHIRKTQFEIPFVCGAEDLGSALRRIAEGASMIRLKGNAGTGDVKNAVTHARKTFGEIRRLTSMHDDEVYAYAKLIQAPVDLVLETRRLGRLPVTTFAAGGIATPADVILMMEMGCDGVFVGSGIFKSSKPAERAVAIVTACTYWQDPSIVAKCSEGLGKAMVGILHPGEKYALAGDQEPGSAWPIDSPSPYRGLSAQIQSRSRL